MAMPHDLNIIRIDHIGSLVRPARLKEVFARYDRLSGAAFEDSPLVKKKSSFMAGVGIAWVLAEAKRP